MQIFVDNIDQMKDFLKYVLESTANNSQNNLDQLTTLNLHHRLLECYLYLNQSYQNSKYQRDIKNEQQTIIEEINKFIINYDTKIDKHYVLFLF